MNNSGYISKNRQITKYIMNNSDNAIQIGLTSIERGNFDKVRPDLEGCFGAHVVRDNDSKLCGLVTDNGEEIMPCIFDDVSVKLDAFIETRFKGQYYKFLILSNSYRPDPKKPSTDTFFGNIWFYRVEGNKTVRDERTGKEYRALELTPNMQQLIELLRVKHAVEVRP